jgi:hypothetical protein
VRGLLLLVVVATVVIGLGVRWVTASRVRRISQNEAEAVGWLRLIARRELVLENTDFSRDGYRFRVYSRSVGGSVVVGLPHEAQRLAHPRFVCYAWPVELGVTGRRAFVVSPRGEIFAAANDGFQDYSGMERIPAPGAAFVAGEGEDADHLEGELVAGEPAGDGHVWIPAGADR